MRDVSEPPGGERPFPIARVSNIALIAAGFFAFLALRRFETFHNETFDLAFYVRWVWGLGRGDGYHPITNSDLLGLHASPGLHPIAWLCRLLPVVPTLLTLQAATVAATAIPLARIAARRIAYPFAAEITAILFLLYPTISTLATYEFHPGALSLLPFALALDFFDRDKCKQGAISLAIAASFREDAALIAALTGLSLAVHPKHRKFGFAIFLSGVLYFSIYFFVIAPRHLPRTGSLNVHFGALGGTPGSIARSLLLHPLESARVFLTPIKLLYVPRLLLPLAFLPLLAPRWAFPALVPIGINLLSSFPAAPQIHSHYSALTIPFLFAAAAHAVGRLLATESTNAARILLLVLLSVSAGSLHMHRRAGATPLSRRWDGNAFREDYRTPQLRSLLARIPQEASIVAIDPVLPHIATRPLFQRAARWTRPSDWVLLSLEHRRRFLQTQNLWRSEEEIPIRNALHRPAYGVYAATNDFLLLRRNWDARAHARGRYVEFQRSDEMIEQQDTIGASLSLVAWGLRRAPGGTVVVLELEARRQLPADLGLEVGWGPLRPNGDRSDPTHIVASLPFDGLFSPVYIRNGERVRTEVPLSVPLATVRTTELYLGVRRIDGSRLDPEAPHWLVLHTQ